MSGSDRFVTAAGATGTKPLRPLFDVIRNTALYLLLAALNLAWLPLIEWLGWAWLVLGLVGLAVVVWRVFVVGRRREAGNG